MTTAIKTNFWVVLNVCKTTYKIPVPYNILHWVNVKSFQNPGANFYGAKQTCVFNLHENWDLTIFNMLFKIHKKVMSMLWHCYFFCKSIHIEIYFDKA